MGLPTGEEQAAIITRLRGDSTLQSLLGSPVNPPGSIFDASGLAVNQAFPYIGVFPITSARGTAKAFGSDSVDSIVQVSIFTNVGAPGAGFAQGRAIASRVYVLLHEQALTLANGFHNFFIQFLTEQEFPEADGLTQQIVQRYQLKTQG